MKSIIAKTLATAAVAVCLTNQAANAADHKSQRLNNAWSGLLAGSEPVLTPQQTAKINNIAYQAAVTRICDGFDLNEDRFMAALADAIGKTDEKFSDDSRLARHNFLLLDLGMRVGVFIAEGASNPESFCANAKELKAQSELAHVWK